MGQRKAQSYVDNRQQEKIKDLAEASDNSR
ncbi:hypothetical protein J2W49_002059 [Hydrogenophaga palleronii]|uniref:Uncharacterized protein n=1 Tax=Hydrogenophaga palleronii TaxID=65655 RepID=A0ABU1WLD3_9BURK|nr:hypothetical protein [Hydrogenophaga palleronii]